ncbi:unnamed protein product [Porites lobata]|uniref:Uncharacterized protein n=1 Tax=Porites lobata TaxID=104759 RepID=A0ABN8NEG6_9CNID|nr:unnamed protein product [Porites lobata]
MSDGDVFDIQEEVEGSPWNPAIEAEQDNQTGTDHKDEDKTDSTDIPEEAAEARKLLEDERELRFNEDPTGASKLGQQKKETLGKNLERMTAAHLALEGHDAKVEELKRGNESSVLKHEKALMEGAYTELKKAQEVAVKSIKVKRQQVEMRLSSKMLDAGDEDEALE